MTVERKDATQFPEEVTEAIAHFMKHDLDGGPTCATTNLLELSTKHTPPFMIMKLVLEACPEVSLRISDNAQLALIMASQSPADIVLMIFDCLDLQQQMNLPRDEKLRCDDIFFRIYPYGFYSEEAKARRLMGLKSHTHDGDLLEILKTYAEE